MYLLGMLLASLAYPQSYDVSAQVNQMLFSGSFDYYQGILENVNVSNGFDGATFHDGTANGNQIVFNAGNDFLSFYTGPDYVGSSATSFTPNNIALTTGSAVYQCGNGVVTCSAAMGIHGTVVSGATAAPEISGGDMIESLTLLALALFVVHAFRWKK